MRVLFTGGPLDGKELDIPNDRNTWEVCPPTPPARFCGAGQEAPKNATFDIVRYKIQRVNNLHPPH